LKSAYYKQSYIFTVKPETHLDCINRVSYNKFKFTTNKLALSTKGVNSVAAKAFVLIETVVGRNKEVVTALKRLDGVKSVDAVTGPYDIIATIGGETLNDIGDIVTAKIHPIAGISRTVTCLVI
jgi:DNA-binding Lrp family transcriptional regulator